MILYHVLSTYQLLECIEHRQIFHKNEKVVLLIYNFMEERFPHYEELKLFNFFDEVYIYPHWRIKFISENSVPLDAEVAFESIVPYKIMDFKKIYIGGIHVAFTTFLIQKKIKFSIFEDGSGALSRPEIIEELEKNADPEKYNVISKFGLYHPRDFGMETVTEKFYDRNAQVEGFEDNLAVDFNLLSNFYLLDETIKKNILEFFRCPSQIECEKKTVILLTQHFSNLRQLSFEEHVFIYQVLFDYFIDGKQVIIKLHPDDNMYYKKLFPEVRIMREKFPAELLPFIFKNKPQTIATITSTGINSIKHCFKEKLCFSAEFENNFKFIRSYYTSQMLCRHLKIKNIEFMGVDKGIVKNMFLRYIQIENNINDKKIIVIDKQNLSDEFYDNLFLTDDTIIFLNNNSDYSFYQYRNKEFFSLLMPIVINVKRTKEEDNYFSNNEVFYVYSNNEEVRNKVKEFEYRKEEIYSGNIVEVTKKTDGEIRIKILEGMLEATEKRLLYYKQKVEDGK